MRWMAMSLSLSLFLSTGCMRGFLGDWDLDFNFSFDISLECLRGELAWSCMGRLDTVATGASWELSIAHAPEGATLVSDEPAVVSVEALGNRRYAVRAENPGDAKLEILTRGGDVFDTARLEVAHAAFLELTPLGCAGASMDTARLRVGDTCHLVAFPVAANHLRLFAGTHPQWLPSHQAHIEIFHEVEAELLPYGPLAVGTDGPFLRLDGIAEGSVLVGCTVGGVTAMRLIHVTEPDAPDASVGEPDASVDNPDASVDASDAAE
jgi:hypothetical protein